MREVEIGLRLSEGHIDRTLGRRREFAQDQLQVLLNRKSTDLEWDRRRRLSDTTRQRESLGVQQGAGMTVRPVHCVTEVRDGLDQREARLRSILRDRQLVLQLAEEIPTPPVRQRCYVSLKQPAALQWRH